MLRENKLPRKLCLKNRVEIDHVFHNGKPLSGKYFKILWEPSDSFKYGIFVKGRTLNAPKRNRIKRIYREAVRLNKKILEKEFKIAVLPFMSEPLPEFEKINGEINRIFIELNKAG